MNKTQHNSSEHVPEPEPNLDAALEALQAVVLAQKSQIDALLACLEGLMTALNHPKPAGQWAQAAAPSEHAVGRRQLPLPPRQAEPCAGASLLGNPADPQFARLHQLMGRLKAA